MKTRPALTLVFFLSMVCVPIHADENKNCGLKQLASLDLARFPGHVLVPVTIQGNSAWMSLNTGSAFSLIFDEDARALQLRRKRLSLPPGMSVGPKGEVAEVAVADDLQIGGIRYRNASFAILSREAYPYPASFDQRPIVGGLGMDVLSTVDFELDIAHGKLNLFSQDHCPGQVVYWSKTVASIPLKRGDFGDLYFPIELDGKTLEASMYPGSQQSTLRTDVSRKLYGFDEHSAGSETRTEADGRAITYRVMNLATPAFEVRNAVIELNPQNDNHCVVAKHDSMTGYDGCRGAHPLHLGIGVLSKLRIYCATKERTLYLTPADTAAPDVHQNEPTDDEFSVAWEEGHHNEHETVDGAAYVHQMVRWLGPALSDSQRQCGGRPKDMTEPVRLAVQLNLDGSVRKAMIRPNSPHWECVKEALAKKTFPASPRDGFWTSTTIH